MKLNRGNLRAMDMPARERSDLEVITGARAPMPDQHTPAPGVLDAIRRIGGPFSTKRRLAGEGTNIGDLHQVPGQTMDQTRVQPVWSETDADGMELLGGDAVSDECDSTDNEEECGPADVPNPGAPGKEDLKRMQSYLDRTLSIQDTRILPRRLGYIFDAGMKSKTSDYFALFGPNGTAMFGQLQDMPGRCKDALIAITQAAGDIWAKTPRWSEIDALERRVYEAVMRIEAEWTAAELDVKLHLMTHSVDGIRKLGPAHQHAMFHAESTWGALININHNRKDPAANIMCAVADYTQCLLYKLRTLQDLPAATSCTVDNTHLTDFPIMVSASIQWNQDLLLFSELPISVSSSSRRGFMTAETRSFLHMMYCRLLPPPGVGDRCFGEVWAIAVASRMPGGQSLLEITDHIKLITQFTADPAKFVRGLSQRELTQAANGVSMIRSEQKSVSLGPLTLCPGSWFLCKPGDGEVKSLWFGRVLHILEHVGPDGDSRVVIEAQWHECKGTDAYYRMPVVPASPSLHVCGPMWLADDVVPIPCWAESFYNRPGKLLMVARSWAFLQRLCSVFC
ncbi:hypothetical protein Vretimale_19074 [Volvox reticuliferus]|uniref:Uncharacterized protein n=1 Tax=Volvox reticuliferus TaxID=1737510 RepID=A0A8J4LZC3_9CHLO|nr:hypothetical protein Vretifemale_20500 [Volvox reticuliferus]GIM16440.1 hypothetical protein Vretimale_19074 [Volvox reticuliferus]